MLFEKLEQRQLPGFMVKYACEPGKREWGQPVNEMPSAERIAEFKGYPSDGFAMAAWRPWFEARNVKLPQWHERVWVFLPSPEPPRKDGSLCTGPPEKELG